MNQPFLRRTTHGCVLTQGMRQKTWFSSSWCRSLPKQQLSSVPCTGSATTSLVPVWWKRTTSNTNVVTQRFHKKFPDIRPFQGWSSTTFRTTTTNNNNRTLSTIVSDVKQEGVDGGGTNYDHVQLSSDELSPTDLNVLTDEMGERYGVLMDTRYLPKLKPSIVQRRLAQLKTYVGAERAIRQSPWKLNRICQLAAGLPLEDALTQLPFVDKKNSDLVAKVLKRTSNLADIRDGLQVSQLEVAECFTTKGMMLRRIKPMGRGRYVPRKEKSKQKREEVLLGGIPSVYLTHNSSSWFAAHLFFFG